jgi:hypothetical protein
MQDSGVENPVHGSHEIIDHLLVAIPFPGVARLLQDAATAGRCSMLSTP